MQCSLCGTQLPMGVAHCSTCGAVTPYDVSHSAISPYEPTTVSSSGVPSQTPPPLIQNVPPPYEVPQQNPYGPLNPYATPLRAPPLG